jgi:hypothetical protein
LQEKKLSEFISENNVYLKDFAEAYNQGLGDILNSDSSKKFPK